MVDLIEGTMDWTAVERGTRVRWSQEGFRALGCHRAYRHGTLAGVSRSGFVRVYWDGLSSPSYMPPGFIEVDPSESAAVLSALNEH